MFLTDILDEITEDPRLLVALLTIVCAFVTMPIVFYYIPGIRDLYFTSVMFLLFCVINYYFSAKTSEQIKAPANVVSMEETMDQFVDKLTKQVSAMVTDEVNRALATQKTV